VDHAERGGWYARNAHVPGYLMIRASND